MLTNHLPEAAQPTLRCPGCKHANPAHSNFCNICGRGLPSVPCPQCGEMNDLAMATMCSRCGGPLTDRADSEAAKDARLRVIEAAMGGGFPPTPTPRAQAAPPPSPSPSPSISSVDVNVGAVAELPPPSVAAFEAGPPEASPAAAPVPMPVATSIPTLTAAIATPSVPPPQSSPASASASAPKPSSAAPHASTGPSAASLARMPRSNESPGLGATHGASGSPPAQPAPTLADFGPSAFNLHHLNAGHSANSAPFVPTGWRTDELTHADFDMRHITELVRTSLAAETVPMLPALSAGAPVADGEPDRAPGRARARPRRLVMAGGVAAALVVAVVAYRVYGPARLPELTPVPLANGGGAATVTTTAARAPLDNKAAQMQASLDRAAELLAKKPTGAGVEAPAQTLPTVPTAPAAAQPPIAAILPTTLVPTPTPTPTTTARPDASRSPHPVPSRETATTVAAARPARSPATDDLSSRLYGPPGTYKAQPAPAAGPCTEGVAALGLCDAVASPTTSPTTPANPRR